MTPIEVKEAQFTIVDKELRQGKVGLLRLEKKSSKLLSARTTKKGRYITSVFISPSSS
jgi:hypothetical protein